MDQLSSLPLPIKILLATLSGGCLVGASYMIDPRAMWIMLIGLVVVALIFAAYLFIIHAMKRRQAEAMGGQLAQHSTMAPRGISDPARRARLDDLRQNFQKGLERFRAAGKDLYSLPWYLVVGEPGSGKSEAIRHCNVGFPPGLQDELQGAGGTINMHWWFTNHAVIVDTAGRLMFEEVPPGTTSEWREFLHLLRKSRPNCPINGLILVIPSDSLIKDNADEIARKAGRIAQQLNTIQSQLDIRFPVFVFITKCDLINGFREFFNNVYDPQLQHQMLGWSNPDPLDQPFRPESIDRHFESVIHRVRRRRLGLLQDPNPQEGGERRLDEVDSLFSLPASMALLAPRLKRYLETIFGPNEWVGKPLFLRGIYFASAMREGSALDLELAQAIGVPVDSLPEGKAWERERAFFLRDVFLDKIFKERGLVTRATNTKHMLRRRQAVLFGCGFVGLFLLLGFSWIGARSLRDSVGRERDFWLAANEGWQDSTWRPIVSPEFKGGVLYTYNGDQPVKVGGESIRLAEFHRRLAELSQSDINVPWVFRPMNRIVAAANPSRRRAQRIVFERGVVAPLVQAARDKVLQSRDQWTAGSSEALAFLVRVEGMIQNRQNGLTADEIAAAAFFKPLGSLLHDGGKSDPDLNAAFEWVYFKGGDGRGYWPPRWLSAGGTLAENHPIATGLTAFIRKAQEVQKTQAAGIDAIKKLRGELRQLRQGEEQLARLAAGAGFNATGDAALTAVLRQKTVVDQAIAEAVQTGAFESGKVLLAASHRTLVEETRTRTERSFRLIHAELERFPPSAATDEKASAYMLPADIRRHLTKVQEEMKARTENTFSAEEIAEMQALDALLLDASAGDSLYAVRGALYQEVAAQLRETRIPADSVLGSFEKTLASVRQAVGAVREKTQRYAGPFATEFTLITRRVLELAELMRTQALFGRYFDDMDNRLSRQLAFPLVSGGAVAPMTLTTVGDVNALLRMARADLAAMKSASPPLAFVPRMELLETRVQRVGAVSDALLGEEGRPTTVVISLLNYADQRRQLMKQLGTEDFGGKFAGHVWRVLRFGSQRHGTGPRLNTDLGRLPLSDGSMRIDFFKADPDERPDRNFALNQPWAPLRLIHQPYARRLPGGKEWEVMLSLKDDAGQERFIFLLLQFDRPLPEIDQWPSANRLGLERTQF